MIVLGLIMSFSPYLRSAMVQFPLNNQNYYPPFQCPRILARTILARSILARRVCRATRLLQTFTLWLIVEENSSVGRLKTGKLFLQLRTVLMFLNSAFHWDKKGESEKTGISTCGATPCGAVQ